MADNILDDAAGWAPLVPDQDGDGFDAASFALGVLKAVDQHQQAIRDTTVRSYRAIREMLFHRTDFDIAKLNQVFAALGPNGLTLLQRSQAAEDFIQARWPGVLRSDEIGKLIDFTVGPDGTLTFDPEAKYPGPLPAEAPSP